MQLQRLALENLRNVVEARLEPGPGMNLVTGANGAGKTSLLEAVFILSTGRSFRTAELDKFLRHGEDCCRVMGQLQDAEAKHALGLERCRRRYRIRIDGEEHRRIADLAQRLPALALHPESHRLLTGGPQLRRRFLDWGLFHVKPGFHGDWQQFRRALRQRNAALKQGAGMARRWNAVVGELGEALDADRRAFVADLESVLPPLTRRFLGGAALGLDYRRGWPAGPSLEAQLATGGERDERAGFTTRGPHRADLRLRVDGREVQERISRGQQKMLTLTLFLAMERVLADKRDRHSVLLVDDPASELDPDHREAVLDYLRELPNQVFLTAIRRESLGLADADLGARFHVERGEVEQLV